MLWIISLIPCGTDPISWVCVFNVSACGNKKLAQTAVIAAKKVDIIYKEITVLNFPPDFLTPWASEFVTKTKTSIGAIAFKAPTNKSPKTLIQSCLGIIIANTTPTIIPIKILVTKH